MRGKILHWFMAIILFLPYGALLGPLHISNIILLGFYIIVLFKNGFKLRVPSEMKGFSFVAFILIMLICYMKDFSIMSYINTILHMFLPFMICVALIKTEKRLKEALIVFEKACFIYSILGIIEAFTKFNIMYRVFGIELGMGTIDQMMRFGIYRPAGGASMTINNCIILSVCLLIVLYNRSIKEENTRFSDIVAIMISINAILTFSRSALLLYFIVLLYYLFVSRALRISKKAIKRFLVALPIVSLVYIRIFKSINSAINQFYLMFNVVFNDSVESRLASNFGANPNGIGNRFELFGWIFERIENNKLFGLGNSAQFSHAFSSTWIKTSIENEYATILFHFGWVGLVAHLILAIGIIHDIVKSPDNRDFETNISLKKYCLLFFVIYLVVMLTVAACEDFKMVALLFGLLIARNKCKCEAAAPPA